MIGTIIILNSAEGVAPEKRSGVRRNAGCCTVSLEQKGIRASTFVARLLLLRRERATRKEIRYVIVSTRRNHEINLTGKCLGVCVVFLFGRPYGARAGCGLFRRHPGYSNRPCWGARAKGRDHCRGTR